MATKKTDAPAEPTVEERLAHLENLAAKHGWNVFVPEPEAE